MMNLSFNFLASIMQLLYSKSKAISVNSTPTICISRAHTETKITLRTSKIIIPLLCGKVNSPHTLVSRILHTVRILR